MIYPEVLDRYDEMLFDEIPIRDVDGSCLGRPHLKWMIQEMRTMENREKFMRWLGFVQFGLCCYGYTTVQEERDWTRSIFKPSA